MRALKFFELMDSISQYHTLQIMQIWASSLSTYANEFGKFVASIKEKQRKEISNYQFIASEASSNDNSVIDNIKQVPVPSEPIEFPKTQTIPDLIVSCLETTKKKKKKKRVIANSTLISRKR